MTNRKTHFVAGKYAPIRLCLVSPRDEENNTADECAPIVVISLSKSECGIALGATQQLFRGSCKAISTYRVDF